MKVHYLSKLRSYSKHNNFEQLEPDFAVVKNLIKHGECVIDVGANFGFYTLFLSRLVGTKGNVYSIEPIPRTYKILLNNINKLKLGNVEVFNYAISDKDGSVIMEIPKFDSGGENFYQSKIVANTEQDPSLISFKIDTKSLDSLLFAKSKEFSFLKIDVEGHELQVINGAMKLINRFKPVLYIEVSDNPDDNKTSSFELFNLLSNIGYSPYYYDANKLNRRTHGDANVNYFFFTDDQYKNYVTLTLGEI